MNKDVIYIDVDDDVTAIIGKIKKAKEKIVALVPPKRAGALQSAVNLRLLERMAKTDKKQLVLITSNAALIALAANAKIPVAKNLQSKPELAEVAAIIVDDGDDIIDGSELPVGDHANSVKVKDGAKVSAASSARSEAIDTTDLDIDGETATAAAVVAKTAPKKAKNRPKIPNFDSFRKKLFLGIGGGVALIALLIWMFVFAPAASVIITASTSPQPVSATVKLGGTAATDFKAGVVTSVSQQDKKDVVVEFEATGQKDVGEKATGSIAITNCDGPGFTIASGTAFTSASGKVFYSTAATNVSGLSGSASSCRNSGANAGTGSASVVASASGESFNIAASNYSIGGTSGDIYARGGAMTGGTSKIAKVVSAADIERAQGQITGQSTDADKAALVKKFTNGEIVIDSSFTVDRAAAVSAPAVDQEAADGKAKLTVATTYTIQAVPKSELDTYLKASLESKINKDEQKIYSTGIDKATLSNFRKDGETMLATVNATGRVGPQINEEEIKTQVKGMKYGEAQQSLEAIDGIKAVDVQFSYFWVRTIPNNTDKIKIEFKVENE